MAKSTTRKVTKVARTGGGRTKRGQSSWIFPTFITTVVILGTFLIVFSRNQRQPDTSPPRIGDHWHSAIGFYLCDSFAPNVPDNGEDPLGIHTHGDGVVHTHPFGAQASGRNAKLELWFDTVGANVTQNQIRLPGQDARRNGERCGDREARVVTRVWDTRTAEGRIVEGNPGDIRLGNNQLITVAFVPDGTDIPKPPSEPQLDNLSDVPGATTTTVSPSTVPGETTTTAPGATTTAPGATTTTPGASTTRPPG